MGIPQNIDASAYSESGFTVTWDDVSTVNWYQCQITDDPDNQSFLVTVSGSRIGTYNFLNVIGGEPATEYNVRVREVYEPSPTTNVGDWSDWHPFTTLGEPAATGPVCTVMVGDPDHPGDSTQVGCTTDAVTVEYRIDSGSWTVITNFDFDWGSLVLHPNLGSGSHTFEARGIDGNSVTGAAASRQFTI